jgi:hypothetical protein
MAGLSSLSYIIVDNVELKQYSVEYRQALNCIDILAQQQTERGGWKFVQTLRDEDILSCTTEYVLVFKVGSRFNRRVIVDTFQEGASLVGHIIDNKRKYFHLHDQCWLVKVKDYDPTPTKTFRKVDRSVENFHHIHTPHWIKDGGSEIPIYADVVGESPATSSFLISNLLRQGKEIRVFSDEVREDKKFLYVDFLNSKVDVKKLVKFQNPRSDRIYPFTTEQQYSIDDTPGTFKNFIGCGNGLQSLLYVNKHIKTVHIVDTNPNALRFTENLIHGWDRKTNYSDFCFDQAEYANYQWNTTRMGRDSLDDYFFDVLDRNPDLIEIMDALRDGQYRDGRKVELLTTEMDMLDLKSIIPLIRQPKSILYFSNVGNYYANWHKRSLSELDTIFNTIFSCAHDTSFFIGWYPANKFIAENVKIQKQPAEEFPWRD